MGLIDNTSMMHSVYNYYMTAYAPTTNNTSRYDTHKKSELKNVYNSIVQQAKDSPLYIVERNPDIQHFAVGMKENVRQLTNTINSLSSSEDDNLFGKKVASSTDSSTVSARYISDVPASDDENFEISVEQLAAPQRNRGFYLDNTALVPLNPDTYSFDVLVNGTDFEFQFGVSSDDTNLELQERLASLINKSNIGINASIDHTAAGFSALSLTSAATGLSENRTSIFTVSDDKTSRESGIVDYLGLSNIESNARNAVFTLNGNRHSAYANTFTVDKRFELNLLNTSAEGTSVNIGLKPDVESMADNVRQLLDTYNVFIGNISEYNNSRIRSYSLMSDINRTNREYSSSLKDIGLTFDKEGYLNMDKDILGDTLGSKDNDDYISTIKSYTNALLRRSSQISLNPMNYVEKTMVAYKNPGKSYPNPYITSIYSGMLFNSYC